MGRGSRKEPDLTNLSKKLTSQRIECTEEIKSLMDCMAVGGLFWGEKVSAAPLCCVATQHAAVEAVSVAMLTSTFASIPFMNALCSGKDWWSRTQGARGSERRRCSACGTR